MYNGMDTSFSTASNTAQTVTFAGVLGAIGRNLNQIARATNQAGRLTGPSVQDLHALLRVCTALRDHIKELINSNTASWNTGHAAASR